MNGATGRSLTDAINQNEKELIDRTVLGSTPGGGATGGLAGTSITSYPTGRLRGSDHDGLSIHTIQALPETADPNPPATRSFSYKTDEASVFANIVTAVPGTVLGGQLKLSGFIGHNGLWLDLKANAQNPLQPNQSGSGSNDSILVGGTAIWSLKNTYALASLVGTWGQTTLKDRVDDCGHDFGPDADTCNPQRYNFNTAGFIGTLTAGQIFDLGAAKLDLRGSVAYTRTDPANFLNIHGNLFNFDFSTWTGTLGLTLFSNIALQNDAFLRPYISGYVRQEWGYHNELRVTDFFATDLGAATSITTFGQANTYGGVDAGVTYTQGNTTYGAAVYYETSGDERTVGGRLGMSMRLDDVLAPARSKAPFNWSGFYAGINGGSARGDGDATTSMTCLFEALCPFGPDRLPAVAGAGSATLSDQAFTAGGQVGLNWQTGRLVYGLELDLQSFKLGAARSGTTIDPSDPTNSITVGTSFHTDWLFTARSRVGWAVAPNLLIYGTGGLAATELRVRNAISSDTLPSGAASASGRVIGWTLGGGAEWALSPNWTLRAEYLHLDLGKVTANAPVADELTNTISNNMATTVDLTAEVVRAGLNYKF